MSDEILKGYHVFGAISCSRVDYREIDVEWPLAEVSDGIFRIAISVYGDDPTDPFLEVVAQDLQLALGRWKAIASTLVDTTWLQ